MINYCTAKEGPFVQFAF